MGMQVPIDDGHNLKRRLRKGTTMAPTDSSSGPRNHDETLEQTLRTAAKAFLYMLPMIALIWGIWVLCRKVLGIDPGPTWGFVGILVVLVTSAAVFIYLRRRDRQQPNRPENNLKR
jgi:TRAP-type uncharacterized transport system fused permease subunit